MRTKHLLVAAIPLVLALGAAPAAFAQDDASGDCTLLTVQEVETALGATGLKAEGAGSFCVFSGDETVYVAVQTGADLAQQREQLTDEVETQIAGLPALTSEAGTGVVVELPGSILSLNYYGTKAWADALPALTSLAELAVPRVPEGPSAEDIARLKALLPAEIDGGPVTLQTFTGDLLLGFMDATSAPVKALNDALAAQGKTAADILLVGVETDAEDDDYSVVAIWLDGGDMAPLVEPLFGAFTSEDDEVTISPTTVGGRDAVKIERADQPALIVVSSGDVALAATVPDAELEAVLARLP